MTRKRQARSFFKRAVAFAAAGMMMLPIGMSAVNAASPQRPPWQQNQSWETNNPSNAPRYAFQTSWPLDQWGRSTHSNYAPDFDHVRNIRRDRHSSVLPPSHGVNTGFFSGEFPTNAVNPFAPTFNNNPNASRSVGHNQPNMALQPGEFGTNVLPQGSHQGGFIAPTSVQGENPSLGSGASWQNQPQNPPTQQGSPSWQAEQSSQSQPGFTVIETPIGEMLYRQQAHTMTIMEVTPMADGSIGRITIPALNNRQQIVRSGVGDSVLRGAIGHFPQTSQWDGNVALASHNRGPNSYFAGIWTLEYGDIILFETTMGVRTYEVFEIRQISEQNLEVLDFTHDNILTMITCVYYTPSRRWSVRARQIN